MLCNHSSQDSCLLGCCTDWHTVCYNCYQELQQVPVQLKHFRLSLLHHTPLSFCISLYSNVSVLPGVVWQKWRNSKQKFRNLQHCQHHMPLTIFSFWIIIAGETLSKQFLHPILQTMNCFYGLVYDEIFSGWYRIITRDPHWCVICHWSQDTDMVEVTVQVDGATPDFL